MNLKTIYTLFSYGLSFVLANSGLISFRTNPDFWPIGLSFIVSSFIILYFLSYISKINENEEGLIDVKKDINELKQNTEIDRKLLNTIKDIILLQKLKMNKRGITQKDILEWLKIIITLIIGYILIKALLSAV